MCSSYKDGFLVRTKPQKVLLVAFLGVGLTTAISMAVQAPIQSNETLNIRPLPAVSGTIGQGAQPQSHDPGAQIPVRPGQVRSLINSGFTPPTVAGSQASAINTSNALSDFEKQFNQAYKQFDGQPQPTTGPVQTTPTTIAINNLPPIDGSGSLAALPTKLEVSPSVPPVTAISPQVQTQANEKKLPEIRLASLPILEPPVASTPIPPVNLNPIATPAPRPASNFDPLSQDHDVNRDLVIGEVVPDEYVEQFDMMTEAVEADSSNESFETAETPVAEPPVILPGSYEAPTQEMTLADSASQPTNESLPEDFGVVENEPSQSFEPNQDLQDDVEDNSVLQDVAESEPNAVEGSFENPPSETSNPYSSIGLGSTDFASHAGEPFGPTGLEGLGEGSNEFAELEESNGFAGNTFDRGLTWWKSRVTQPLDGSSGNQTVDTNSLVYQALKNSPRIQGLSQDPLIRELQVVEADSEFDAVHYVRSQFEDRVDPVGNSLTTGNGEPFLKDNIWSADLGLRKKNRNGASYELNQRLGFQNSNSNFFSPQDQGTATLALNVTQPLLRGRGRYYNQSQILIAQSAGGVAWETFQSDLQDELLSVVSVYWQLYLNRSLYLQKEENVRRGAKILDRLEGRSGLDSLPSQIARARSSVQTRKTELANSRRDVKNTETELRRLVADKNWVANRNIELLPLELPHTQAFDIPLEKVVYTALEHRPEIKQVMRRARIATIQRDVSANELLPELSLLLGTYVSALRGDSDLFNSVQDQFGQVKPGYNVGIQFELPYRNRAARSRHAQRNLQLKKIRYETDEIIQSVIADTQVALNRVNSATETLVAAEEAIRAARTDLDQFERRWESFALVEGDIADGQTPTTILDQLLDSQERLAASELVYVQAEVELKVAEVALQRSMGTLLVTNGVHVNRWLNGDHPGVELDKAQIAPAQIQVPTQMQVPTEAVFDSSMQNDAVPTPAIQGLPPMNPPGMNQPGRYWSNSTAVPELN
jgi:outer membrane protein TolC